MANENNSRKHFNDWPNDVGFDVKHEERTPVELKIDGIIPPYVAGTLYRTGPGGYSVDTEKGTICSMDHWFDGFSQNHRFQIIPSMDGKSTRVLYNSRSAVDPLIEDIRKTGRREGFSFGTRDPCMTLFKKVMSLFVSREVTRNHVNIGVTISANAPGLHVGEDVVYDKKGADKGHASGVQTLFTKTDAPLYQRISPETLEPIGVAKQTVLHPELDGPISAAHAKSDPVTGDIFNFNLKIGRSHVYKVFRVSAATGQTDIVATITDAPGAYLHSLSLTENHVILCVWGSHFGWGGLKLVWEKNVMDSLSFDPRKKALWYVIDRRHDRGVVAKYESDTFFCFHTINAWEEPSQADPNQTDVVVDMSIYDNIDIIRRLVYNNIKSSSPEALAYEDNETSRAMVRRWRLPSVETAVPTQPRKVTVEFTVARRDSCDLPSINPKFLTKRSRYVYGVTDRGNSTFFDGLVKLDTETLDATVWLHHGQNPGEPIFIPNPNGTDEDDGVLLSVVLDGHRSKSYLLVLDAKNMQEVARASMDCVVPFGFHGSHVAPSLVGAAIEV